jgi:drug/metabolite transporter (DMT)-like permease
LLDTYYEPAKHVFVLKTSAPASPGSWLPAFVALSAIWGSSFALIKVAVDAGMSPLWVSCIRCVLGAAALWLSLAAQRRAASADLRLWWHAGVVAVLLNSLPFTLIAYGETRVSSVQAGVLIACTPLFTLGIALVLLPGERLSPRRLAGLALGLAGVLVVVDLAGDAAPVGLLGGAVVLLAAACYGAGYVYTRRYLSGRPESGLVLSTVQVTLAALQLAVVTPVVDGSPGWPGMRAAGALVVLGVLGTGLAYVLNFAVVRRTGPTIASTVTYLVPLWSTVLGGLLLSEAVGWHTLVGGLLIVAGVAVSRDTPRNNADGATRPQTDHRRPGAPDRGRPLRP